MYTVFMRVKWVRRRRRPHILGEGGNTHTLTQLRWPIWEPARHRFFFMHSVHPTTTPCLILHHPTTFVLYGLYCCLIYRHGYANNTWKRGQLVYITYFYRPLRKEKAHVLFRCWRGSSGTGDKKKVMLFGHHLFFELTNFFWALLTGHNLGDLRSNQMALQNRWQGDLTLPVLFFSHALLYPCRSVQQERQDPLSWSW